MSHERYSICIRARIASGCLPSKSCIKRRLEEGQWMDPKPLPPTCNLHVLSQKGTIATWADCLCPALLSASDCWSLFVCRGVAVPLHANTTPAAMHTLLSQTSPLGVLKTFLPVLPFSHGKGKIVFHSMQKLLWFAHLSNEGVLQVVQHPSPSESGTEANRPSYGDPYVGSRPHPPDGPNSLCRASAYGYHVLLLAFEHLDFLLS